MSAEGEVDDAALISVDSKGIDIRVRQGAQVNFIQLAFTSRGANLLSTSFSLQFVLCSSISRDLHLTYHTRWRL